ncbi:MAG: DUF2752 domain-containing protein [Nitrospirae bacterium]|nr:DUF2752 domain-containing protein [Nitrospirota bacterium]
MPRPGIGPTGGGSRNFAGPRVGADLTTSERQLGLIWGTVVVVLLLLAMRAEQLAQILPACAFKTLAGIPCPTCGMTRATLALVNLDLMAALRVNPLATGLVMAFVVGGLVAGLAALLGRPLKEPRWDLRPAERLGLVMVIVANWAYLVSRGI